MRIQSSGSSLPKGALRVLDANGLCVSEAADGYYWKAKGARAMHGPFVSLVDALDDVQRESGADLVGDADDWLEDVGYEAAFPA
jgi:hypothetical protein